MKITPDQLKAVCTIGDNLKEELEKFLSCFKEPHKKVVGQMGFSAGVTSTLIVLKQMGHLAAAASLVGQMKEIQDETFALLPKGTEMAAEIEAVLTKHMRDQASQN